jgi:adenylate cyclase, class 1
MNLQEFNMDKKQLAQNKDKFIAYNTSRKHVFIELAPRESELVLYLLPWLLSINHPNCPGFIEELEVPFRVFGIDSDVDIRDRETAFKRMFNVKQRGSLLKSYRNYTTLQGLYTIGSIGTVSQTASSDCDIWVCYDKRDIDSKIWNHLNQKINLIKDWLDLNLKIPVFLFVSDIIDIRQSRFGSVDAEGSGSTQRNVLKEEFYRTTIVICGKIPLWWVSYHPQHDLDYDDVRAILTNEVSGEYEFIDFGNIEKIEKHEYFGAALWQLHKSLTRPLKSIIKMALLKTLLDSPEQKLIGHQFRDYILGQDEADFFPDPSVFTLDAILTHYQAKEDIEILTFLKECFYLRCEIKPYSSKHSLKKLHTKALFEQYPIDIKKRIHLSRFNKWDFNTQIDLGNRLIQWLLTTCRDIAKAHTGIATKMDEQDLTIIGRKLFISFEKKENKIAILQKPTGSLNLTNLTLSYKENQWQVYSGTNAKTALIRHADIINVVAFVAWNELFMPNRIRMEPNASSVTLQEVINLGKKMNELLGTFDIFSIDFAHYLKKVHVVKALVIVSFEKSPWEKDINDFTVIYKNNWGELFVQRFNSPHKLEGFFKEARSNSEHIEINYYVQRNSTYFEKIIERTKKIITPLKGF